MLTQNLSQARLNTFERDLGLTGDDFNTAVSILNVGSVYAQSICLFGHHCLMKR